MSRFRKLVERSRTFKYVSVFSDVYHDEPNLHPVDKTQCPRPGVTRQIQQSGEDSPSQIQARQSDDSRQPE